MVGWQFVDCVSHSAYAVRMVVGVSRMGGMGWVNILRGIRCSLQEFVVNFVSYEWGGEFAEVLFEGAGDRVDIQVGI